MLFQSEQIECWSDFVLKFEECGHLIFNLGVKFEHLLSCLDLKLSTRVAFSNHLVLAILSRAALKFDVHISTNECCH
jgi:hypothetical protein